MGTESKMINSRTTESDVSRLFVDRWSPRSFDKDCKISSNDLNSIFEAARWAPSSFNDQPWKFLIARQNSEDFDSFLGILNEGNQVWAKNASVIGFVVSRLKFSKNQKPNSCAEFDCGSAWMSLTLQARKLGLYTHGMAGIDHEKAYQVLGVDSEDHKIICGFTIGAIDKPEKLPEALAEKETMSSRKPLAEVYSEGISR